MKKQEAEKIMLYCPFAIPGTTNLGIRGFWKTWLMTRAWGNESDEKILKRKKAKFKVEKKQISDSAKIIREFMVDRITAEECKERVRATKISDETLKSFLKTLDKKIKETPEESAAHEAFFKSEAKRLSERGKLLRLQKQASDSLSSLMNYALKDDIEALKALVDLANQAVGFIQAVSSNKPELMRPIARNAFMWPVMANIDPKWKLEVNTLLQSIELGEETIHGKFNQSKAYHLEGVSRRYARAIIDTLENNRLVLPYMTKIVLESKDKILGKSRRYQLIPTPKWAKDAAILAPFSRENIKEWLNVGIEMLREQVPDLPQHSDWKNIKTALSRKERATDGRLWNDIKDALLSPMKTIARKDNKAPLPKKR